VVDMNSRAWEWRTETPAHDREHGVTVRTRRDGHGRGVKAEARREGQGRRMTVGGSA
jgi:hypothetical protein